MEIAITTSTGVQVINTDQIAFLNSDGSTGSVLDIYQGSGATQPLAIEESPADIITATSNLFFQVTIIPTPLVIRAAIPYTGSGFAVGQVVASGKKTAAIIQSDSGSSLDVYNYQGINLFSGDVIQSATGLGTLSGDATYTYPNSYTTYLNISKCGALIYSSVADLNSLIYQSSLLNTSPILTTLTSAQLIAAQAASGGGSSNAWSLTGNAGTDPNVNFLGTTDGENLIIQPDSGNVGIGTASPAYKLDVLGKARFADVNSTFLFQETSLNILIDDASGATSSYEQTPGGIAFQANTTVPSYGRIEILGDKVLLQKDNTFGNVGIGTASPAEKLDVVGNLALSGTIKGTALPAFDDDADAASLATGDFYQTTGLGAAPLNVAGIVMVKQ